MILPWSGSNHSIFNINFDSKRCNFSTPRKVENEVKMESFDIIFGTKIHHLPFAPVDLKTVRSQWFQTIYD